jgi:hypothetical protein
MTDDEMTFVAECIIDRQDEIGRGDDFRTSVVDITSVSTSVVQRPRQTRQCAFTSGLHSSTKLPGGNAISSGGDNAG